MKYSIVIRFRIQMALNFALLGCFCANSCTANAFEGDAGNTDGRRASRNHVCISGVYPHLTMRNDERECGTGAVVPWQGSLWAITYAPHKPDGSSDKLYEITADLTQKIFEDSVGGTPANRMIHNESQQLLIGPYLIDKDRNIRVIPPTKMFGRLTGNARHLTDPENKVYYATMEEALYEVDVQTLEVKCHIRDNHSHAPKEGVPSSLPGYHGKGLYSGFGRVVYANNGDNDPRRLTDPTIPSGALAQWFGKGEWQLVRRNQFTEVTGPGGIHGNKDPDSDPIWAMGWDARSLLLALLEEGKWHYYRLPKGSHSYDGSHGWNTEWPRIREIGEEDLLATMHGTFWRFPANFSRLKSAGVAPRSNYLKVIGDFCRWNDRIVLGCDDSAQSEFANTRPFKARYGSPGQSNSNLWFIESARLDNIGPVIGRGSVWLRDDLAENQTSDPYLFSGYDHRQLHIKHESDHEITLQLEVDREGTDDWQTLKKFALPAGGSVSHVFDEKESGAWVRIISRQPARSVTAHFQYRNRDDRDARNDSLFDGIADREKPAASYGLMRSLSFDKLGIAVASERNGKNATYYELNQQMQLVPVEDPQAAARIIAAVAQPAGAVKIDSASILLIEDGKRYRVPKIAANTHTADTGSGSGKTLENFLSESLAVGADVKASSHYQHYEAANAVDGSLNEDDRWVAQNDKADPIDQTGESRVWIEIDLGEPKSIQSVWVISGWENRVSHVAADFDLEFKKGQQWQAMPGGKIRGNTEVQREIVLDQAVSTRHVRLRSDTEGFVRIYEIGLFDRKLEVDRSEASFGTARVCREVATERDLLNVGGTFYELPARNAQGLAKMRPVSTHRLAIHDFCSHNGLLLITGIDEDTESEHIFRSENGKAAVWAGVVDDLWKLGKPRGKGGPWHETKVLPDQPSDPYLMTGYDQKQVSIACDSDAVIRLEVDVDGTGLWIPYQSFEAGPRKQIEHEFPVGFSAYWVRAISDRETTASVVFTYR